MERARNAEKLETYLKNRQRQGQFLFNSTFFIFYSVS